MLKTLPDGPVRFLFVGRLLREKGVSEFLEAAESLLAEVPNRDALRFDLVGEWEDDRSYIPRADLDRLMFDACGCPPSEPGASVSGYVALARQSSQS